MLRPEQRRDVQVAVGEGDVDDVMEAVIDGGGIADQTDALAVQPAARREDESNPV